jgi:hypothetical protein
MSATIDPQLMDPPAKRWFGIRREFGERLKTVRMELGDPQWKFRARLGVGEGKYQQLENGTYPLPSVLGELLAFVREKQGGPQLEATERSAGKSVRHLVSPLSEHQVDKLEIGVYNDYVWAKERLEEDRAGFVVFPRQSYAEGMLLTEFLKTPPREIDIIDYSGNTWLESFLRTCFAVRPKIRINLYLQTMEHALRLGSARQVNRISEGVRNLFGTEGMREISGGHLRVTPYDVPPSFVGVRVDRRILVLSWFVWYPHPPNLAPDKAALLSPYEDRFRPPENKFGDWLKLYGDAHPHIAFFRNSRDSKQFDEMNELLFQGFLDHLNAIFSPVDQRLEFEVSSQDGKLVFSHDEDSFDVGTGRVVMRQLIDGGSPVGRTLYPPLIEFRACVESGKIKPERGVKLPSKGYGVLVLDKEGSVQGREGGILRFHSLCAPPASTSQP